MPSDDSLHQALDQALAAVGQVLDRGRDHALEAVHTVLVDLLTKDRLTPLRNAYGLERLIAGWRTGSAAVIAVELDDFKSVNSTYGHAGGDALLSEVGGFIDALQLFEGWSAFHVSGDEFVVVMAPATASEARLEADTLKGLLEQEWHLPTAHASAPPAHSLRVTVALTVDPAAADAARLDELVREADDLVEFAKAVWEPDHPGRRAVITRDAVGDDFDRWLEARTAGRRRRFHCPACGRSGYVNEPPDAAPCGACVIP